MNAAFEDCQIFDEALEAAGDAIANLALDNFIEMRDRVASPLFLARKKIETFLSGLFPNAFVPLYDLMNFSNVVPYHEGRERARRQDRMLVGAATVAAAAVGAGMGTVLALLL